jgi:hypothetical protein
LVGTEKVSWDETEKICSTEAVGQTIRINFVYIGGSEKQFTNNDLLVT